MGNSHGHAPDSAPATEHDAHVKRVLDTLAKGGNLPVDEFDKRFEHASSPGFGRRWRESIAEFRDLADYLPAEQVAQRLSTTIGHGRGDTDRFLTDLFHIFSRGEATMDIKSTTVFVQSLLNWNLWFSGWPIFEGEDPVPVTASLCSSLLEHSKEGADAKSIAVGSFVSWANAFVPRIGRGARLFVEDSAMAGADKLAPKASIQLPVLDPKDVKDTMLDLSLVLAITLSLPDSYLTSETWTLLYSSLQHGQSCNRFQHHAYRYTGPTLVVVRDMDGGVYVAAVDQEWRERRAAWGDSECRLYRVMPSFKPVKKTIKVYDDIKTRHVAHGIGFGPEPSSPDSAMLWLEPDLSSGSSTFAIGHAVGARAPFKIGRVEVWGCGSEAALSAQQREKLRDNQAAEQRQKAMRPPASEWQDSPDRLLLTMAGALKVDEESRVSTRRED